MEGRAPVQCTPSLFSRGCGDAGRNLSTGLSVLLYAQFDTMMSSVRMYVCVCVCGVCVRASLCVFVCVPGVCVCVAYALLEKQIKG